MILNISDQAFRNLFKDKSLHLPIRWSGEDFYARVEQLLDDYSGKLKSLMITPYLTQGYYLFEDEIVDFTGFSINRICTLLKRAIRHYLDGFPAKAYNSFSSLMRVLQNKPLRVYQKSSYEMLEGYQDSLNLFRAAIVDDNIPYDRSRIFHTPYNLRSKVSTCRYSIAGFPSLYLSTSLKLCCEEIKYDPYHGFAIASKFKIERSFKNNNTEINVIELALKPQDFLEEYWNNENGRRRVDYLHRNVGELNLRSPSVKGAYILWYPLIAVCSFIRTNKSYPFAQEYIIPQLLMQWVRNEMALKGENGGHDKLIGIRYFSCSSVKASDMGYNYVFPVSGKQISQQKPYCPILSKAFHLTIPDYINEYKDIDECERALIRDNDLKPI